MRGSPEEWWCGGCARPGIFDFWLRGCGCVHWCAGLFFFCRPFLCAAQRDGENKWRWEEVVEVERPSAHTLFFRRALRCLTRASAPHHHASPLQADGAWSSARAHIALHGAGAVGASLIRAGDRSKKSIRADRMGGVPSLSLSVPRLTHPLPPITPFTGLTRGPGAAPGPIPGRRVVLRLGL